MYKQKYLNLRKIIGGGNYAYQRYDVNDDGTIVNSTFPYVTHAHTWIIDLIEKVFNYRKGAMILNSNDVSIFKILL